MFARLWMIYIVIIIGVESHETTLSWMLCKEPIQSSACIPAIIPGTILTSLLAANVFEGITLDNVYTDKNLLKIPDIAHVGSEYYTYYYVSHVSLNETRQLLCLDGVNYRATVFIDGQHILPENESSDVQGMFLASQYVLPGNTSMIAIKVSPPDFPGNVTGGQGGDHLIAKNGPIAQFAAGWDWISGTPDRMTGLWDRVYIKTFPGKVELRHPHLQSTVNVTTRMASMNVSIHYYLELSKVTDGISILLELLDTKAHVVATAMAKVSNKTGIVTFDLPIDQPVQLWWPHTHGNPYLYRVRFSTRFNTDTDWTEALTISHGFRQISGYLHPQTQGWAFKVNNVDIFLTGGNWITTDQLLRFASNETRYWNEISLHANMGMNLIRVWGGGIAEREYFYDACNKLGVLVFQELWMTGDNNGRWGGEYTYPVDDAVYLRNVKSVLLRVRNHPSLLLWCAGNELMPVELNPKPQIQQGLRTLFATHDPTRFVIMSSMAPQQNGTGEPQWDPTYSLSNNDGPYTVLFTSEFYNTRNPGMKGFEHTPMSFNPELGSVSTPVYESLQRFLSKEHLETFPNRLSTIVDEMWTFHAYENYNTGDSFDHIYDDFGGTTPSDTHEYCDRAQIVQYDQYKALFEGFRAHAWEWYAAVLFWKSQSPWPALRGNLYDYYLVPNGGYFGVQAALRDSLHVQLDGPGSNTIRLTSRVPIDPAVHHKVVATTVTASGVMVAQHTFLNVTFMNDKMVHVLNNISSLWPNVNPPELLFCELCLYNHDGTLLLSRNIYRFGHTEDSSHPGSLITQPAPHVSVLSSVLDSNCHLSISVQPHTDSGALFFVAVHVTEEQEDGGSRMIAPIYFSENYVTILPNQTHKLTATIPFSSLLYMHDNVLMVTVAGWNMPSTLVPVTCAHH